MGNLVLVRFGQHISILLKVLTQYSEVLAKTRQRGAVLVDIVDTASFDNITASMLNDQSIAMNVEFKLALNAYLKQLIASPVRSLADAIVFNKKHSKLVSKQQAQFCR